MYRNTGSSPVKNFVWGFVMVGILGIFAGFFLGSGALLLIGGLLFVVGIVGLVAARNL